MHQLLSQLEDADLEFLVGVIASPVNLTDDRLLKRLVSELDQKESREQLVHELEREIRYLGSSDIAYAVRRGIGLEPGVPFREIIFDVAKILKVRLPRAATDAELIETLVTDYTSQQFAAMTPEEQQKMLEELGVEKEKAAKFVARSAGVFAIPVLIQAFNAVVVEGLIKKVIFGTIAKFLGSAVAKRLFTFIAGKFPWWVAWVGPAAWTVSVGWTTLDLQGPASRKTVPIVLYLGLSSLRQKSASHE